MQATLFFPIYEKTSPFLPHHIERRWNKEALCATLRHLCNDKAALGKKIWIRHRAKHLPDTKEEEFFSRTLVNLKVWAELPKKNFHVSEFLFNVCLFVKLISLLMKSKQRAWLTALCHKFSKVKSLSQASKYNTFLPAPSCSKWPFYFISTKELYETYHHIRLGRGFQDDSWSSRPFQHGTST